MEIQQQVALTIASLPEREAADLLARLPEDVIEQVARWLPSLGSLAPHDQDSVAAALAMKMASSPQHHPSPAEPNDGIAWATLTAALARMDLQSLARRIAQEMPQTVATLMRALDVNRAARLLSYLPTHQQLSVVLRMRTSAPVEGSLLLELVELTLADDPDGAIGQTRGVDMIARLLMRLDHATEKSLLENLRQEDEALVDQVLQVKLLLQDLDRVDRDSATQSEELVDAVLRLHAESPSNGAPAGVPKAA